MRNAAQHLEDGESVLVHNVDGLSNLPLRRIFEAHEEAEARATLAVQSRVTDRALAVDERNNLCGRWEQTPVRPPHGKLRALAFSGIQILAPGVARELPGEGAFSIVELYLQMASRGERVRVFEMDAWYWADVGTTERLRKVRQEIETDRVPMESLTDGTFRRE